MPTHAVLASVHAICKVGVEKQTRYVDPCIDPLIETSLIDSARDRSREGVESHLLVVDHLPPPSGSRSIR
jgi:hypothetical protein